MCVYMIKKEKENCLERLRELMGGKKKEIRKYRGNYSLHIIYTINILINKTM